MISGITYQNQKRQEIKDPPEIYFATVLGVYEDGLNLIFDGESESINKRYRYNKSITFKIGDRVKVTKVSGTYLAEYPIGKMTVSLAPGNIKMMSYQFGDGKLSVTWTDPDDTVIDDVTVSRWAGTYLVRNEIDYPKNETDGTVVLNSTTRNAYSSTPYIDSGLQNGKQYYYALFPYSDDGKVNRNPENRLGGSPNAPKRYGVRIDKKNSDPDTRVEYLFDAIGKKPARINAETGLFDYGDWADVGFVKDNKPCMLRKDGTVDYYLNPTNLEQKEDGTPSDVSNTSYDGNAMSEFPLWYLYQYQDDRYDYIILSEKQIDNNYEANAFKDSSGEVRQKLYIGLYPSIYPAKSIKSESPKKYYDADTAISAHASNGAQYNLFAWSEKDYIGALLIVLSKSTNFNECFKSSKDDAFGNLQFNNNHIFFIEGTVYSYLAGIVCKKESSAFYNYIKLYPPYNSTGDGYTKVEDDYYLESSDYSGYVSQIVTGKYGRIPYAANGSTTSYYTSFFSAGVSKYWDLLLAYIGLSRIEFGVTMHKSSIIEDKNGLLSAHF